MEYASLKYSYSVFFVIFSTWLWPATASVAGFFMAACQRVKLLLKARRRAAGRSLWFASLHPRARWGGVCGRSHCHSAGRWRGSTDRSPSTGARGGRALQGISWPWRHSVHEEHAQAVCSCAGSGCRWQGMKCTAVWSASKQSARMQGNAGAWRASELRPEPAACVQGGLRGGQCAGHGQLVSHQQLLHLGLGHHAQLLGDHANGLAAGNGCLGDLGSFFIADQRV